MVQARAGKANKPRHVTVIKPRFISKITHFYHQPFVAEPYAGTRRLTICVQARVKAAVRTA